MPRKLEDMDLFAIVNTGTCILNDKGLFRQVDLYERNERLYAEHRGGFLRLLSRGLTTIPTVKWDAIEGVAFTEDHMGPEHKATGVRLQAAE